MKMSFPILFVLFSATLFANENLNFRISFDAWQTEPGYSYTSGNTFNTEADKEFLPRIGFGLTYKRFSLGTTFSLETDFSGITPYEALNGQPDTIGTQIKRNDYDFYASYYLGAGFSSFLGYVNMSYESLYDQPSVDQDSGRQFQGIDVDGFFLGFAYSTMFQDSAFGFTGNLAYADTDVSYDFIVTNVSMSDFAPSLNDVVDFRVGPEAFTYTNAGLSGEARLLWAASPSFTVYLGYKFQSFEPDSKGEESRVLYLIKLNGQEVSPIESLGAHYGSADDVTTNISPTEIDTKGILLGIEYTF